jgi:hypothetical protein
MMPSMPPPVSTTMTKEQLWRSGDPGKPKHDVDSTFCTPQAALPQRSIGLNTLNRHDVPCLAVLRLFEKSFPDAFFHIYCLSHTNFGKPTSWQGCLLLKNEDKAKAE